MNTTWKNKNPKQKRTYNHHPSITTNPSFVTPPLTTIPRPGTESRVADSQLPVPEPTYSRLFNEQPEYEIHEQEQEPLDNISPDNQENFEGNSGNVTITWNTIKTSFANMFQTSASGLSLGIDKFCDVIVDGFDPGLSNAEHNAYCAYLHSFFITILILPVCVWSYYNWYYLLFYKYTKVEPFSIVNKAKGWFGIDLDDSSNDNWFIMFYPLDYLIQIVFNINPVKSNLFGDIVFFPFHGILSIVLLFIIIFLFVGGVEGTVNSGAFTNIISAIIVILWLKWVCGSLARDPPTAIFSLVAKVVWFSIFLIVPLLLLKVAFYAIVAVFLFFSFFGIGIYEGFGKVWDLIFIIDKDKEYESTHDMDDANDHGFITGIKKIFQMINKLVIGNIIWISYFMVFFMYFIQLWSSSSYSGGGNLKPIFTFFLIGLMTVCGFIIYKASTNQSSQPQQQPPPIPQQQPPQYLNNNLNNNHH